MYAFYLHFLGETKTRQDTPRATFGRFCSVCDKFFINFLQSFQNGSISAFQSGLDALLLRYQFRSIINQYSTLPEINSFFYLLTSEERTASMAGVSSALTSCSQYRVSTCFGILRARFPMCRRRVVLPRPFGPTRPYRRPAVILSFASLNNSRPPA